VFFVADSILEQGGTFSKFQIFAKVRRSRSFATTSKGWLFRFWKIIYLDNRANANIDLGKVSKLNELGRKQLVHKK